MVGVKVEVLKKDLQNSVDKASKRISDLRPVWLTIAREFYKANRAIFTLKDPGKYADFSGPKIAETWSNPGRPEARTRDGKMTPYQWVKQKNKGMRRGYPLLKYSGRLERSITGSSVEDAIMDVKKMSLEIGTSVPYGVYHQEGTDKMPMRQFLFLDPSTTVWAGNQQFSRRNEAWKKAINDYVDRVTKDFAK